MHMSLSFRSFLEAPSLSMSCSSQMLFLKSCLFLPEVRLLSARFLEMLSSRCSSGSLAAPLLPMRSCSGTHASVSLSLLPLLRSSSMHCILQMDCCNKNSCLNNNCRCACRNPVRSSSLTDILLLPASDSYRMPSLPASLCCPAVRCL